MDETNPTPKSPVRDYVATVNIQLVLPVAATSRDQVRNFVAQAIKPLITVGLATFHDGRRCAELGLRQYDAGREAPTDIPLAELHRLRSAVTPPFMVEDPQWSPEELEAIKASCSQEPFQFHPLRPRLEGDSPIDDAAERALWPLDGDPVTGDTPITLDQPPLTDQPPTT
jgi:hypothetical protein